MMSVVWINIFLFLTFFSSCGSEREKTVSLKTDYDEGQVSSQAYDSSSEFYGIHAPLGWKQLPITFKITEALTDEQKIGVKKAMETWEIACGKILFSYTGSDPKKGDDFEQLYSSLNDTLNSMYTHLDWTKTGKRSLVMATTIWTNEPGTKGLQIATSDVHFNAQYYFLSDSLKSSLPRNEDRDFVDMESLALHELGHLLGLSHMAEESDPDSIMNPTLVAGESRYARLLSSLDIKRIQKIYGCQQNACDRNWVEKTIKEKEKDALPKKSLDSL